MYENDIGTAIVDCWSRAVRVYEAVLTRTVSGLPEGEISWRIGGLARENDRPLSTTPSLSQKHILKARGRYKGVVIRPPKAGQTLGQKASGWPGGRRINQFPGG